MDILFIIIGILCLLTGLAGCFLPVIPGPPVAYAGLLLLHFTDKVQYSTTQLLLWLLLVIILQVLDYFIPMLGSKYSGGTRWGTRGCLAGTIIGLFFMPWGIVLGPFLGAFIGELLGGKETRQALKSRNGFFVWFPVRHSAEMYLMRILRVGIRISAGTAISSFPHPSIPLFMRDRDQPTTSGFFTHSPSSVYSH